MKKLLAVCFVLVLVCTLLCGCGGPTVDLGDRPSVSREEAVVISEKDGEITGRLDLDRYSFAQLSEAEKEENVLSFDGDVILFEGSYKGSVTLEGNGHKKKCSAEFHTNNSEPIRFTLTADYGSQDRYVVFIAGGHGSEGSDSDTTEPVTPASLGLYVTFNGERYPTYATKEEALANPSVLPINAKKEIANLVVRCNTLTEDYSRIDVDIMGIKWHAYIYLTNEKTGGSDTIYTKNFCAKIRYQPRRYNDWDNYLTEYVAFIFE